MAERTGVGPPELDIRGHIGCRGVGAAMDSHGPERADADALLDAIEAIYACATDPSGFDRLPESLAPVLRAKTVNVWCIDTDLEPAVASNAGLPASGLRDYLDGWIFDDQLMAEALNKYVGQITTPEGMFGARGYRRLPVFDGFYSRYDIVHQMARFDVLDAGWLSGISCQRGSNGPPMEPSDRDRVEVLAYHLRRAWSIALRMGTLSSRARSAEALLSSCRLATWLLDGQRHLYGANQAAERLVSTNGSGIMNANHSLRFADAETDAAFGEALRHLEAGQRTPADLPLRQDGRQEFVWGTVIPIGHDLHGTGTIQTLYLLVLARPGSDADVSWRQLEQRLPISRTEADVLARLMRAEDPRSIAEARGSTLETIRGYEKSLRAKLDCHSRAELVAKGWRTVAAIPSFESVTP